MSAPCARASRPGELSTVHDVAAYRRASVGGISPMYLATEASFLLEHVRIFWTYKAELTEHPRQSHGQCIGVRCMCSSCMCKAIPKDGRRYSFELDVRLTKADITSDSHVQIPIPRPRGWLRAQYRKGRSLLRQRSVETELVPGPCRAEVTGGHGSNGHERVSPLRRS
ncbi:hypothetical protein OH76DRAFT_311778 [Lentinus brumalis]|uniref:Uncharacterized protein n=1 Tax=Lentinus brumalis TaxID=2498619 RepID=A0A371CK45_9APHY|nr:hypothetical protein OH76DRAFT_311778 [Polyporus brumalis]